MEKELINYIKQSKKQGFSNEEIKKALINVGWKQKDIDEGFKTIGDAKPKRKTGLIIAIIIIVVILAGISVFAVLNFEMIKNWFGSEKEIEEPICADECGNAICDEIVCQAIGCPCAETIETCPVDCEEGKKNEEQEETDETADWKIYQNDEFGFTIKYPSQFIAFDISDVEKAGKELDPEDDFSADEMLEMLGVEELVEIKPDLENLSDAEKIGLIGSGIEIQIRKESIEEIAEEMEEQNIFAEEIRTAYEILGDNYKGITVREENFKMRDTDPNPTRYVSHLIQGPIYSYVLRYNNDIQYNRALPTTHQIAHSFRLLD